MLEATREQIAADLEKIFRDTMGDWEYSGEITQRLVSSLI